MSPARSPSRPRLLVAGCALLAVACGGGPSRPNVLLITVDTLRPDHLSVYGYERDTSPSLEAFFGDAAVYTRAYSAEAATAPSVVSILTGRYPAAHGVRLLYQKLDPDVTLLPEILAGHGYQTAGVVSNIVLTDEALGIAGRFDDYDDYVDERESMRRGIWERRASRTTDAALSWLASRRDEDRPHFLWVHYIDPHGPYGAPEDRPASYSHEGQRPIDMERVHAYQRVRGVDDGLYYVDRYDEEIAYADREVGRLLKAYASLGLLDDAVVVFTSDHGETMIEYERYFSHGYHVWEPIVRVPLLVRGPGSVPGRHDDPVSLVDLVPTILQRVGIEPPAGLDGVPLGARAPDSPISLEATHGRTREGSVQHRAVVRGERKWFVTVDAERAVQDRGWVDLGTGDEASMRLSPGRDEDYGLLLDWVRRDPDPGGRPAEYREGAALDGPKVAPGRTEQELEALRSLGYVE